MLRIFLRLLFLLVFSFSYGQSLTDPLLAREVENQRHWVDSIYSSMTLNEKVGQLFMPMVFSNQSEAQHMEVIKQIRDYHIGGIIFSKGGPQRQARQTNTYQAVSKLPLLIAMDAEWGLGMRLDSTYSFPWNMTLGAIKDTALIRKAGERIGAHCKRLGVHINFAPVVDINTNPDNPIIGNRSFGEQPLGVSERSLAFMNGMQSAGVLATAKHFPGHGDTHQDSHKTLPTVEFNAARIDSVELAPYKRLINKGLSSVMIAHLNVPSLNETQDLPTSLSHVVVTDILKKRMQFEGLIFTDALNMKGVSNYSESGEVDLAAFLAGNDMLLISEDIPAGVARIMQALENGELTEARLEHSVKKILKAKYKVGLHEYTPIGTRDLYTNLNTKNDSVLNHMLFEKAITVVQNKSERIPVTRLDTERIAYVHMGDSPGDTFLQNLQHYTKVDPVEGESLDVLTDRLRPYSTVIIGYHKSNASPWSAHKFSDKELVWLYELGRKHNVVLTIFTKPYALMDLKTTSNFEGIIVAYQNHRIAQSKAAQVIFGGLPAEGSLPVSINQEWPAGTGVRTALAQRLSYGMPEQVHMNGDRLRRVDSVMHYAVSEGMTPGGQILIARSGKVIYHKAFGYHTDKKEQRVALDDMYDLASLTKILSTLPLVMELVESGVISLETNLGQLLPEFKASNKGSITIKEMLSHYARLEPWIPFYEHTLDTASLKPNLSYYRYQKQPGFQVEVAKDLYMRTDYADSIYKIIKESDLLKRRRYRYSDLPYYLLKKYIETHYGQSLDALTSEHFYKSLGANWITYSPRERYREDRIVPSEIDNYFRYQELDGYVHDMGAAMQGGIGGHAGLFSNANDVAKIMQLYLQKGYYGGRRYFKTQTLDLFNTCYYCENDNRRGVGFDKPQLEDEGPTCGCISMTSFGHSGFTGTYAWADPEEQIVYVFLSNRTYPTMDDNRLLKESIRTEIQRLIYESIEE